MIKSSRASAARVLLAATPLAVGLLAPVQAFAAEPLAVSVTLSSPEIVGGDSGVKTITLSEPAPATGVSVGLRGVAYGGSVIYEDGEDIHTVRIPAGATSVRVPFHVVAPETEKAVRIQAVLNSGPTAGQWNDVARLKLLPADPADRAVTSVTLDENAVHEGTDVTGTVTLAEPAPVDGITVNILLPESGVGGPAPTDSTLHAPSFVTIPNGSRTATFPIDVAEVPYANLVPVTASLGTSESTAELVTVRSNRLTLSYEGADRGSTTKMAVGIGTTWNPLGATVKLSSSNPDVTVPATVKLPGGVPGAAFTVSVGSLAEAGETTRITATWLGRVVSVPFAVR
ncbi:hypothetical protein [Actinocorallia populi]|uniref:hypothetical protein n=1 Tax=Actinocorallia populi TaxID=2079200 RepID=UPI000D089163|nr:hypothetical protein [Actinocorallia populi]